jgi:DNA-binding GntR family transcriptional regulator
MIEDETELNELVASAIAAPNPKPLFRNAAELAVDMIREAIYSGQIAPGERIKEEHFADVLGISRTPIREALLTLQAEHLVETVPRRGVTVRGYTPDEVSDLYDIRAMLEGYAANRAATRRTPATIEALHDNQELFSSLEELIRAGSVAGIRTVMDENARFHQIILATAGSRMVQAQVGNVSRLPLRFHAMYWSDPARYRASVSQHEGILAAIADGDADQAKALMEAHVLYARDIVVDALKTPSEG